jgi:hypothetical protein
MLVVVNLWYGTAVVAFVIVNYFPLHRWLTQYSIYREQFRQHVKKLLQIGNKERK